MPPPLHLADPAFRLRWLPQPPDDWKPQVAAASTVSDLVRLSQFCLGFLETARLDRALTALPDKDTLHPMRLAVLASSTTHHLLPSLRIAALRRGILLMVYECGYGQYVQELAADESGLKAFSPQVILVALDAHHLADLAASGIDPIGRMRDVWELARERFGAVILQQTALPVFPALLGSNEHRHPASPRHVVEQVNFTLRQAADDAGAHLVAVDDAAADDGLQTWHDAAMWFRAKQEVHPAAGPLYGELVAPLLAAIAGKSRKCLVLDLDNTLWGGVLGDDGVEGIALGQGHAAGEAFLEFQQYCLRLRERGVLLAVCSKNTESVVLHALETHPAMLLRGEHFSALMANWQDKPANLRAIAQSLNIGLDALVFADDNPFERELVRRELPEVAVPDMPDDPADFAAVIARAGYFDSLGLTDEDLARAEQYQANAARESLRESATDLESYLQSLRMELHYRPFDRASLPRLVQLIGKTNQFNLTTRRHTAEDLQRMMSDADFVTLQLALSDSFGDNGTIAAVIAHEDGKDMRIDTWLMSCRVLGRRVEDATLHLLADIAQERGLARIVGELRPTAKNVIVRDLYTRLGFRRVDAPRDGNADSEWYALEVADVRVAPLPMFLAPDAVSA